MKLGLFLLKFLLCNMLPNTDRGMRNMTSDSIDVLFAIRVLTEKIQVSDAIMNGQNIGSVSINHI